MKAIEEDLGSEQELKFSRALAVQIITRRQDVDWPKIEKLAGLAPPNPDFRAEVSAIAARCLLMPRKLSQAERSRGDWLELAARCTAFAEAGRQLDLSLANFCNPGRIASTARARAPIPIADRRAEDHRC